MAHSIRVDQSELIKRIAHRTVRSVAHEASVSERTIQRMQNGEQVAYRSVCKVAHVVGCEPVDLLEADDAPPDEQKTTTVEFTISRKDLSSIEAAHEFLKRLHDEVGDVAVIGVRPGSTVVVTAMSNRQAEEALAAVDTGQFEDVHVVSARDVDAVELYPRSSKLPLMRSHLASVVGIVGAVAAVLLSTATTFNFDEWTIVLGVFAFLTSYELGRWARYHQEPRPLGSKIGVSRLLVALLGFAFLLAPVTSSYGYEEFLRIVILGGSFICWEAGRRVLSRHSVGSQTILYDGENCELDARITAAARFDHWISSFDARRLTVVTVVLGFISCVVSVLSLSLFLFLETQRSNPQIPRGGSSQSQSEHVNRARD